MGYQNDRTEERRDSVQSPGDSTDDEALEHASASKAKGKRRFSLDFLFARKQKEMKNGKSQKSKRSQSTVDSSFAEGNEYNFRSRHPSIAGAEFAL